MGGNGEDDGPVTSETCPEPAPGGVVNFDAEGERRRIRDLPFASLGSERIRISVRKDELPPGEAKHLDGGITVGKGIQEDISVHELLGSRHPDQAGDAVPALDLGVIGPVRPGRHHGIRRGRTFEQVLHRPPFAGGDEQIPLRFAERQVHRDIAGQFQRRSVRKRQEDLFRIRQRIHRSEDRVSVHFRARGDRFEGNASIHGNPPGPVLHLELRDDTVHSLPGSCPDLVPGRVQEEFTIDRPVIDALLFLDAEGQDTSVRPVLAVGDADDLPVLERQVVADSLHRRDGIDGVVRVQFHEDLVQGGQFPVYQPGLLLQGLQPGMRFVQIGLDGIRTGRQEDQEDR